MNWFMNSNISPPYWMRHLEFSNIDERFVISNFESTHFTSMNIIRSLIAVVASHI